MLDCILKRALTTWFIWHRPGIEKVEKYMLILASFSANFNKFQYFPFLAKKGCYQRFFLVSVSESLEIISNQIKSMDFNSRDPRGIININK